MQSLSFQLNEPWFTHLSADLQDLAKTSILLYDYILEHQGKLPDYSFVVFSMSKAYEGFLKSYLFKKGLIDKKTYEGHRFRIGRALNPDLRNFYRDEQWLYDDLATTCGQDTAREIWEVWLKCRNRVFHFFPGENKMLTLEQAGEHLNLMINIFNKVMPCLQEK